MLQRSNELYIAQLHDNSCDRTDAKQRVAPNPFEYPDALMRRGFRCEVKQL